MPLTSGCTKAPEMEMLLVRSAWTQGRTTDTSNYTSAGVMKGLILLGVGGVGLREGFRAQVTFDLYQVLKQGFPGFCSG